MTIRMILEFLEEKNITYTFNGNHNTELKGFSALRSYRNGTFTWIRDENMYLQSDQEVETAIVPYSFKALISNRIFCENPKKTFFEVLRRFYKKETYEQKIGAHTYISENVAVGKNVSIGSNCTLDGDIEIGDCTRIANGVTIIGRVKIGEYCNIKSGVIIGHGDMAYEMDEATKERVMLEQYGGVRIGSNVWIGPNTVINKGTLDDTRIDDNVIIDGLCYISHNVVLEVNSVVIAGTTLFGSCVVGKNSYISTSIIRNHIKIGADSTVGMGSVIYKDVPPSSFVLGNPAKCIKSNMES